MYIDEINKVEDLRDGEYSYDRKYDYYESGDKKVLYVQRRKDRLYACCEDGVDRCVSGQGPYTLKRFYQKGKVR